MWFSDIRIAPGKAPASPAPPRSSRVKSFVYSLSNSFHPAVSFTIQPFPWGMHEEKGPYSSFKAVYILVRQEWQGHTLEPCVYFPVLLSRDLSWLAKHNASSLASACDARVVMMDCVHWDGYVWAYFGSLRETLRAGSGWWSLADRKPRSSSCFRFHFALTLFRYCRVSLSSYRSF